MKKRIPCFKFSSGGMKHRRGKGVFSGRFSAVSFSDSSFRILAFCSAFLILLLTAGFFLQMGIGSYPAWEKFGISMIWSCEWDPEAGRCGVLPAIAGTLLTSALAMAIAVPAAFVTAFCLTEAPPYVGAVLGCALDLLAAIPSIIYGMWGLFVLAPLMQNHVQVFLAETLKLKYLPFVGEPGSGFGFLTAGLILALMILPYISAVMRDVFRMTPPMLRESAFGIGCTRWETALDIVMKHGARGVAGGVFIGLGRALGETMAVLFVIGNIPLLPDSLFSCGSTIASTIANNFAEADGIQRNARFALGLILLLMSFGAQFLAQYWLTRSVAVEGKEKRRSVKTDDF